MDFSYTETQPMLRDTLARYTDVLFRLATGSLVKPKIGQSIDDLRDRVCDAQSNAPVIDRRLRELPAGAQALVRLMGLSRCPVWKAGHLIALAAAWTGYVVASFDTTTLPARHGQVDVVLDAPDGAPSG